MRRWKVIAAALAALLAAPAADRFGGSESRAYAEADSPLLQYYPFFLNSFCSGECVKGPLCCQVVLLKPGAPG